MGGSVPQSAAGARAAAVEQPAVAAAAAISGSLPLMRPASFEHMRCSIPSRLSMRARTWYRAAVVAGRQGADEGAGQDVFF